MRRQTGVKFDSWREWWEVGRPVLVCRVFGHDSRNPVRKFGGEILCPRCRAQVGRWS